MILFLQNFANIFYTVSNWFEKLDNFIFTAKFQVYTLLQVKRFLAAAIDIVRAEKMEKEIFYHL
jgi:hypothetical protein